MSSARTAVRTARDLKTEISQDEITDWAASLSYRFLLALFPFFIFLGAMGGLVTRFIGVENPALELMDRFGGYVPSEARDVLATELDHVLGRQQPGLLSVGLVAALWAASGGMGSTMRAMNHAYDVTETRPFWKRTALSIGLTLLSGAFFTTAFVLAVAGDAVSNAIAAELRLGNELVAAMLVARFVLAVGLLCGATAFLYWAAPNVQLPFKWLTPGSVLFVVTWIVGSLAFGWYASNVGSYGATYGALGGVVVLMIWFYLTAFVLLAGAELNALLAREVEPEKVEAEVAEAGASELTDANGEQRGTAQTRDWPPSEPAKSPGLPRTVAGVLVAMTALWRATGRRRAGGSGRQMAGR